MDSGIDSTESSNGSMEEAGRGGGAGMTEGGGPNGSPDNCTFTPGSGGSCMAIVSSEEGGNHNLAPTTTVTVTNTTAADNIASATLTVSSVSTVACTTPTPSPLRTLALAATGGSEQPRSPAGRSSGGRSHPATTQHSAEGDGSSSIPHTLLSGRMEVPEGSRLQLHFPVSLEGCGEGGEACELEAPAGLTLANVSPSMCLSAGYEAYSQGYAVLPYENNALQNKLRTLRLKMRQHQYRVVCPKSKERKLRVAVSLNNVQGVEQLLRERVNPKAVDDKERSPLHIAASKGYTDIARLLLQHGANPNQKDAIGNTALHLAACTSHISMVTLLLKSGTDVRQPDNQGYSPLHLARSKLKLLQRDNNSSSHEIKQQVYQVIEMMQTFLECSGSREDAELLSSFTSQLSLSDSRQEVESDVQALLDSLNNLSLAQPKVP